MLILTRLKDESIIITTPEGRIEITILKVQASRGKVSLGIEAPKRFEIHRKEIQAAIDKERKDTNGVVTNLPS